MFPALFERLCLNVMLPDYRSPQLAIQELLKSFCCPEGSMAYADARKFNRGKMRMLTPPSK